MKRENSLSYIDENWTWTIHVELAENKISKSVWILFKASRFLSLSVPAILKSSMFEIPIIPQTLNMNNLRTTSAKSINVHNVSKLIKYFWKKSLKRKCLPLPFSKYCCLKVLSPAQWGTWSERAKFKNFAKFIFCITLSICKLC